MEESKSIPPEILHKILSYCDYNTLKQAKNVNFEWEQIVDYLIQKRCSHEIPPHKYNQLKDKWIGTLELNELYDNWKSWQNIENNITFEEGLFYQLEENHEPNRHISCLAMTGNRIAIAFENSVVEIYDRIATFIQRYQFNNLDDIETIHLVCLDQDNTQEPNVLLTACEYDVYVSDLNGSYDDSLFKCDHAFGAFRNYFCGIFEGVLKIARVHKDDSARKTTYNVELSLPIDSNPDGYVSSAMTDSQCVILIENQVKIVHYKQCPHYGHIIDLTELQFTVNYRTIIGRFHTWIFENRIIILTYWGLRTDDQVLEIYLLNDGKAQKPLKMFRPYDSFQEEINYIWLHGSTLLLCFMSGVVLFYEINDWNAFDINEYSKRVDLPQIRPICAVDVAESFEKRVFYIAGVHNIFTILGCSNR